jgi:hypothetical protein
MLKALHGKALDAKKGSWVKLSPERARCAFNEQGNVSKVFKTTFWISADEWAHPVRIKRRDAAVGYFDGLTL